MQIYSRRIYHDANLKSAILVCYVSLCIVVSASLNRPLWIDELFHFATGGYASTIEAWQAITYSIEFGSSHGQTGIYMLVDYWLLHIFGASLIALRLPSILSGIWLFFAAISFMQFRGFSWRWQILLVIALSGQNMLMYFIGEARPYMPLAAATVGILAYYFAPLENRSNLKVVLLGVISVITGVLVHPYFLVYWFALYVYAYLVQVQEGQLNGSVRVMIKHANLALIIVGTSLYFVLASFTWGRSIAKFNFDPFEWIDKSHLYSHFISWTHMQFLNIASWPLLVVMLGIFVGIPIMPKKWRIFIKPLLRPITLIFLALFISAVLSYISYIRGYWIVDRQWIASLALCPIAVVWFFALLVNQLENHNYRYGRIIYLGIFILISAVAVPKIVRKSNSLFLYMSTIRHEIPKITSPANNKTELNGEEWVDLANKNIQAGGPVWPVFKWFLGAP